MANNSNNGFRVTPLGPKQARMKVLENAIKGLQTATQVNQLMLKQVLQNEQRLGDDVAQLMRLVQELQYRVLAIQRVASFDLDKLTAVVDELRLKDFDEYSSKEDKDNSLEVVDGPLAPGDVFIATSKAAQPDKSVFRLRVSTNDLRVKDLADALMGKTLGETVKVVYDGVEHEFTLLGVRRPTQKVDNKAQEAAVESKNS
jgi:hypothetical protein